MSEQRHFVLGGCVGKDAQDNDCVLAMNSEEEEFWE